MCHPWRGGESVAGPKRGGSDGEMGFCAVWHASCRQWEREVLKGEWFPHALGQWSAVWPVTFRAVMHE